MDRIEIAADHLFDGMVLLVSFQTVVRTTSLGEVVRSDAFAAVTGTQLPHALVTACLVGFGFAQHIQLGPQDLPGPRTVLTLATRLHAADLYAGGDVDELTLRSDFVDVLSSGPSCRAK